MTTPALICKDCSIRLTSADAWEICKACCERRFQETATQMRHDAAPLDTACIYCGNPGQRIPYQQACFAGKDVWLEDRWVVICTPCIDEPAIPTTFPFKHVRLYRRTPQTSVGGLLET